MRKTSSPCERVRYGLESIPEEQEVTVGLRDLMQVHQALGEFIRFFHQPLHYPKLADVEQFLGSRGSGGGMDLLSEVYLILDAVDDEIVGTFILRMMLPCSIGHCDEELIR